MFTVAIGHWTVYVWSLAGVHAYRYGDCCVHTLSKPSWVINGRKQKENSWLHVEQIWQLSLASCIVYLHLHQFLHGRFWTFLEAYFLACYCNSLVKHLWKAYEHPASWRYYRQILNVPFLRIMLPVLRIHHHYIMYCCPYIVNVVLLMC